MSEDSTGPKRPEWVDDRFKSVQGADVTDEKLLPRRFDFFAAEMRQSIAHLANQILPALHEINETLRGMDYAIRRLESDRDDHRNALTEIKQTLARRDKARRARK